MAEKVAKLGIKRDNNFLYYIKGGDVWQVPRKRPGMKKGKPSKAAAGGITMESGYIYFLDKGGDIARSVAAVGGQKRKKAAAKKTAVRKTAVKKAAAKKTAAKKTAKKAPAKKTAAKKTAAKKAPAKKTAAKKTVKKAAPKARRTAGKTATRKR